MSLLHAFKAMQTFRLISRANEVGFAFAMILRTKCALSYACVVRIIFVSDRKVTEHVSSRLNDTTKLSSKDRVGFVVFEHKAIDFHLPYGPLMCKEVSAVWDTPLAMYARMQSAHC